MKKLTPNEFLTRSNNIHNYKYDYSKTIFINVDSKVLITCREHGDFWQRPDHHMVGIRCKKCSIKEFYTSDKLEEIKNKFINSANKKWNNKYNYSKVIYQTARKKIIITCPIHGDFLQTPDAHLNHECIKCTTFKTSQSQRRSINEFIELATNIHLNFYDYSNAIYINDKTKIIITCPYHGDFLQLPYNHLMGKGCHLCKNKSKGEEIISKLLILKNIHFIRQKTFDKCRSPKTNHKLYFDFFIPELNLCIEFDGRQHFYPVDIWSGEEGLIKIQYNDNIKNNFCKNNKIILLRITYKDREKNNISKLLNNMIDHLS